MKSIIVNVDAGEGEPKNQRDIYLLPHVDAINIALGGHAGCESWSKELANLASDCGKRVHLHPGYPDREGFGRRKLNLAWSDLCESLTVQRAVLPDVHVCKFHGSIYNQANLDTDFAEQLVAWCKQSDITEILAPSESEMANRARIENVSVLREAFVDRRYAVVDGRLALQPRSVDGAVLDDVDQVLEQASLIAAGRVNAIDPAGNETHWPIECDTLCFHGDGETALEVAQALSRWKAAA